MKIISLYLLTLLLALFPNWAKAQNKSKNLIYITLPQKQLKGASQLTLKQGDSLLAPLVFDSMGIIHLGTLRSGNSYKFTMLTADKKIVEEPFEIENTSPVTDDTIEIYNKQTYVDVIVCSKEYANVQYPTAIERLGFYDTLWITSKESSCTASGVSQEIKIYKRGRKIIAHYSYGIFRLITKKTKHLSRKKIQYIIDFEREAVQVEHKESKFSFGGNRISIELNNNYVVNLKKNRTAKWTGFEKLRKKVFGIDERQIDRFRKKSKKERSRKKR